MKEIILKNSPSKETLLCKVNFILSQIENYKKNNIDLQTQYEFNRIMRH